MNQAISNIISRRSAENTTDQNQMLTADGGGEMVFSTAMEELLHEAELDRLAAKFAVRDLCEAR